MPTYHCTTTAGLLDAEKKARVAREITRIHEAVTGAQSFFAQVIFNEVDRANLYMGGKVLTGRGYFYEPTVLTGVTTQMSVMTQETFGPVATVLRAQDAEDAAAIANNSRYGLGSAIWSRDVDRARSLAGDRSQGARRRGSAGQDPGQ